MTLRIKTAELPETKRKLVDAGVALMRTKGFNATTVDDICSTAGMTKGAFFHYFKSKDELAKVAVRHFHEGKAQEFQDAQFRKLADPLDRVFGRLDFATGSYSGTAGLTKGCLIGTFAQELSFTHPELRSVCLESFLKIAQDFERDLAEAKAVYAPKSEFDPKALAMLYISVIQGSLMLAKASESNAVLMSNVEQFRKHVENLFGQTSCSDVKRTAKRSANSHN